MRNLKIEFDTRIEQEKSKKIDNFVASVRGKNEINFTRDLVSVQSEPFTSKLKKLILGGKK